MFSIWFRNNDVSADCSTEQGHMCHRVYEVDANMKVNRTCIQKQKILKTLLLCLQNVQVFVHKPVVRTKGGYAITQTKLFLVEHFNSNISACTLIASLIMSLVSHSALFFLTSCLRNFCVKLCHWLLWAVCSPVCSFCKFWFLHFGFSNNPVPSAFRQSILLFCLSEKGEEIIFTFT